MNATTARTTAFWLNVATLLMIGITLAAVFSE